MFNSFNFFRLHLEIIFHLNMTNYYWPIIDEGGKQNDFVDKINVSPSSMIFALHGVCTFSYILKVIVSSS